MKKILILIISSIFAFGAANKDNFMGHWVLATGWIESESEDCSWFSASDGNNYCIYIEDSLYHHNSNMVNEAVKNHQPICVVTEVSAEDKRIDFPILSTCKDFIKQ